jgi:CDP-diacylglycerol--inositol 3-phosphatidyltransferase
MWVDDFTLGYVRVGFMLASLYYAKSDWVRTLVFYLLAFVGDVVDGYVARAFDMCTFHNAD